VTEVIVTLRSASARGELIRSHDRERMMVELPRLKCPYCNYEWVPRVPQPRKCPRCRNVLWRLELSAQEKNEKG